MLHLFVILTTGKRKNLFLRIFKRNNQIKMYKKFPPSRNVSKFDNGTIPIGYKTKSRTQRVLDLWCHQKTSFISKWLYIFALKNRCKRNLPLLLHLNSAPFCSVSQSRVHTLLQRYIIIVIYKWELQSYFFIISSIRHFTASSKPFLIPCDNP